MKLNLNCNQVLSLINFYVEDKLNPVLKKSVEIHISKCSACRQKAEDLKNIIFLYNNKDSERQTENSPDDNVLIKNLSAYIDNELNSNDTIKIRKMTIANSVARKKLESMYKFQKLLHSAYQRTKNNAKTDYSKSVIAMITNAADNYTTTYFNKILILFFVVLLLVFAGFLYLYF